MNRNIKHFLNKVSENENTFFKFLDAKLIFLNPKIPKMCDPIPVILENIVNPDVKCDPSSGTSPLAYY